MTIDKFSIRILCFECRNLNSILLWFMAKPVGDIDRITSRFNLLFRHVVWFRFTVSFTLYAWINFLAHAKTVFERFLNPFHLCFVFMLMFVHARVRNFACDSLWYISYWSLSPYSLLFCFLKLRRAKNRVFDFE